MNAEILETIRARLLRFGVQIPELLTQRKFVSAMCHAHSNAHKPPKTVAPTVLVLEYKFLLKCIVLVNTYPLTQNKVCHAHSNAQKPPKPVTATVFMLDKKV